MTVLEALRTTGAAFSKSLGWSISTALAGAILSFIGGMLMVALTHVIFHAEAFEGIMNWAIALPALVAQAAFLVIVSQVVACGNLDNFGVMQWRGVGVLTVIIIAVAFAAPHLPRPLLFFVPLALSAVLTWTPLVPALAVGPVWWSPSRFIAAVVASLPFFFLAEMFGLPLQATTFFAGLGFMEGGAVIWPTFGAIYGIHLWLVTATAAIVPTVVYLYPPQNSATVSV